MIAIKSSKNDLIQNISSNKLLNVSKNLDINVNMDMNILTNENINYNVQNNIVKTIKGYMHKYIEQDKKEKFLQNLYQEVSKSFGLDIKNYHIKAKDNKQESNEINLQANQEVVLRCGSNALIINESGIEFKTSSTESNSSSNGQKAKPVNTNNYIRNMSLEKNSNEDIILYADTNLKDEEEVELSVVFLKKEYDTTKLENEDNVLFKEKIQAIVKNSKAEYKLLFKVRSWTKNYC